MEHLICPPEIEWLEYLEQAEMPPGRRETLKGHLRDCPSCRALVDAIESQTLDLELSELPIPRSGRDDPAERWPEERVAAPAFAGLWLTTSDFDDPFAPYQGLDRAAVLLLGDPWHDQGEAWVDAAPFSTDAKNLDPGDLGLKADKSSLGVNLRVLLPLRAVLHVNQLEAQTGVLSGAGASLLEEALEEYAGEERHGSLPRSVHRLESVDDPPVASLLPTLRAPYREHLIAAERKADSNVIPIIRLLPSADRPDALAAAAATVTVGVDEYAIHQVELRDADRAVELRVRLGRTQALIQPRRGDAVKLRGSEAALPHDRFTKLPILAATDPRPGLREGGELLAELRRILEWA